MRHSDPKLTANVYCDPFVLDVHSALDALPKLPLDSSPLRNTQTMRATGTDGKPSNLVAPTSDFPRNSQSSLVTMLAISSETGFANPLDASGNTGNEKRSLSFDDNERSEIARPGFEPGLSDSESLVLPLHHQAGIVGGRNIRS